MKTDVTNLQDQEKNISPSSRPSIVFVQKKQRCSRDFLQEQTVIQFTVFGTVFLLFDRLDTEPSQIGVHVLGQLLNQWKSQRL